MSGEGKLVCVTGASGYIASWVVKLLLLRGYSVNATVRNLNDPTKVEHLMALEGAKERLRLFRAELTEEGSFDSAIAGCVGVFHMASPCFLFSHDPQTELVDPAVKGALNILSSCAKKWYALSKIEAEAAALRYASDKGIDLVTICPWWVLGPLLQPTINTSSSGLLRLIGAETYEDVTYGWVNVKDVANAHIQAFEMESASERYCLVEGKIRHAEILRILREFDPTLPLPSKCVPGEAYTPECKFSRKRAESLGIEFIPIDVTLKEMIESFKEKQLITF